MYLQLLITFLFIQEILLREFEFVECTLEWCAYLFQISFSYHLSGGVSIVHEVLEWEQNIFSIFGLLELLN